MRYGNSRFEVVFSAGSGVHLMAALAHCAVGSCIYIPLKVLVVGRILQLIAEIDLIKTALWRHFHHEVGLFGRHTDDFLSECDGRSHAHCCD